MKKSISVSTQKKLIGQALNNTKTVAVSTICRKTRQRAVFFGIKMHLNFSVVLAYD